jgi:uncharacterized protein (TIGR02594 family)
MSSHFISRRGIIVGAASLPFLPASALAQGIDDGTVIDGKVPPLPDDLAGLDTAPAFRWAGDTSAVGAASAKSEEIAVGKKVLAGAKSGQRPVDVANYFYKLGQSSDPMRSYVREWPERANPVIVEFFRATSTTPTGDITPWCAAFINWCIARGNSKNEQEAFTDDVLALTTRSAASGSFRCWKETRSPKEGDLAVFAQKGTEGKVCSGQGHVAFYLGQDGNTIKILGGNQILAGTSGAVTKSSYPLDNGEKGRLKFLRFVTSSALG